MPVLYTDVCTVFMHMQDFFLVAVDTGSTKHELAENFVYDYKVNSFFPFFSFSFFFCLRSLAVRKHYFLSAIAAKEST